MSFRKSLTILALALPLAAAAQSEGQLVDRYTSFAGSSQNAKSLVAGLRDGKEVTLTRGTTKETFTPPTGKMGYGNVDHALALAAASLEKRGVTNPTPAQLESSVMEILRMRADGKGWGQIADAKGFKLGEVKRPDVGAGDGASKPERAERHGKPDRPERPERHGKGH